MRFKILSRYHLIIICHVILLLSIASYSANTIIDNNINSDLPPSTSIINYNNSNNNNNINNNNSSISNNNNKQKTSATSTTQDITSIKNAKICPGIHIRNDLKSFEQLKGCNIIDGPLTIALISNKSHPYEPKDYENITFPDLREVTEYLLFFRVEGLSTLSGFFPNLSVIRGNQLVENYALIIYEMMHLQKINLLNLTDILRGSVRIESNPNLCGPDQAYWDSICRHSYTTVFLRDNKRECKNDQCPDNQCTSQKPSIGRCHEFCAGGCYEDGRSDRCYSCRYFIQGNDCRDVCDPQFYEYKGRCITEQECISKKDPITFDQCSPSIESDISASNLKAIRKSSNKPGKCQPDCPHGFEEDPSNKNRCKACDKGKCRKVCTPPQGGDKPFTVTNVNSLRELSGCNVINGSLEISMKGGKNVLHELETAFQELEEIGGYLKITRSYPILTLGFLNKLKAINGSNVDRGQYSLLIIDNPNLQGLFMHNDSSSDQRQLIISGGKIFVHLNPKLCPHRIEHLKTYAKVADWDEHDVSLHTNGDKEACNTEKLEVQFLHGTSRMAMIRFQNFALKLNDQRSLLYYLVHYREAIDRNVTMFDGRDGCNSKNDVWSIKEVPPIEIKSFSNKTDLYQDTAITVKPSTRYALYVKTFTILAGSTGALSDIIYFSTAPDTPGIPRQIEAKAKSHDIVRVSWLPPSKPNGIIATYTMTVKKITDLMDSQNTNICDRNSVSSASTNHESESESATSEPPRSSLMTPTNDSQAIGQNTCSISGSDTDIDEQVEVVTFQDLILDIVYIKQPCSASKLPKNTKRRKRSAFGNEITSAALSISSHHNQSTSFPQTSVIEDSFSDDNSTSDSIPSVGFNSTLGNIEVSLIAGAEVSKKQISYDIKGLEHYSTYSIEVVACHGDFKGVRTKPSADYRRCSLQAITQVRTLSIKDNDKILADTIKFNSANESISKHIITWNRPDKPNGRILAYRIRYQPKHGNPDLWTEGCLNNAAQQFELPNLNPGAYLLSIQTVSDFGGSDWSEPSIEFEIPQNHVISPAVLAILIVLGLVVLAVVVAFGTYYYQKKCHKLTNGLVYASVNPDYIQYDPDEWEVDKSNVIVGEQIGTGAFGLVYKGELISEKGTLKCAVKTVPPTSTAKQRMDFLREASIMKQFDTFHVVKLMGVVSTTNPVYVIMEFMENGDLKSFLRSLRESHQREKKNLVDGIYLMVAQIADGMAYLSSRKFVHRDLAARNCMVGENRVVKIGDFGLTRDIYVNDYYRRDTHGRLPVRWMAPESLLDNLYTPASDVWSFGIVVWEIVTFSNYPYQGYSNEEVIKRVCGGFNMSRPDHCPDKLWDIMRRCWRKEQVDRPSFIDVVEELLPETEDKLFPNCFYQKMKADNETNKQTSSEENNSGAESYPLLSWTSNRINGLTNGVNHVQSDTV